MSESSNLLIIKNINCSLSGVKHNITTLNSSTTVITTVNNNTSKLHSNTLITSNLKCDNNNINEQLLITDEVLANDDIALTMNNHGNKYILIFQIISLNSIKLYPYQIKKS